VLLVQPVPIVLVVVVWLRALFDATFFAGLRKAGMPEE
jgi:hypothetical protein